MVARHTVGRIAKKVIPWIQHILWKENRLLRGKRRSPPSPFRLIFVHETA
jgi:hypothetical protein